ncbi:MULTISPECIES: DNA polymerase II [unclassified Pseudoalteromonas]|uniref:DNA polymerase II n=1 Tax=unclassified Pseudoalteromonas TaxID=194690 RepID=UPI00101FCBF3|nr:MULTISPECIES: DNA polymerase II [unclassified Pseudoalteromonas]NIZ07057.1 DNA polymerase II [Pseudoalteromonas sp. HF66]RZD23195.1 DNA polymerase II [Pseudoalteromonas sp. MEBiC 03485]
MVTDTGFILSKEAFDSSTGVTFVFWLWCKHGPLKVLVEQQEVVFFIPDNQVSAAERLLQSQNIYVRFADAKLKNFQNQSVICCYFNSLKDYYRAIKILKSSQIVTFEDDVRPIDRFLMERFIKGSVWVKGEIHTRNDFRLLKKAKLKPNNEFKPNFKLVSIDIECNGDGVLFSIGLVGDGIDKVLMIGRPEPTAELDYQINWCEDEIDLLSQFETEIQRIDPDVLIGWNVIEFDFSVLHARAEALGISLKLGRNKEKMRLREGNFTRITIPGRVVVDGIDTLKNATYHYDSFSLANVASIELGEEKLISTDNRLEEIIRQFNEEKLSLANYNRQDCILVLRIFEKLKLLDFAVVRSQLTGLELERMGGSVAAFTNLYLPLLHRSGYVAPNLGDHGLSFDSPGGYVMSSQPGLYQNILVLDYKSLYPSIMRTFCIDPLGLIEGLKKPDNAIEGFNQAQFSRTEHHLPELIRELAATRQIAKDKDQPMLSQAIKIIMNSLYGVLGSKGCRFYDPRLSSSITLRGHEIMQTTKQWIEEWGYEVIYGDTDSTFVRLDDDLNSHDCNEIGTKLAKKINKCWQIKLLQDYKIDSFLEIEFETHYSPFFMPTIRGKTTGSKKRYVGKVEKNGASKLVFKGMETVRSDWTELAHKFQTELFEILFSENYSPQLIVQAFDRYVKKLYAGEFDSSLIYRKRLGQHLTDYQKNIPPHVKAAKQHLADNPHLAFQRGQIIEYVYTPSGAEYYIGEHNYDYSIYVNKQLLPIAEMIVVDLGTIVSSLSDRQIQLF